MNTAFFRVTLAFLTLLPLGAAAQVIVDAGPDVVLECEGEDGTEHTLNGTAPTGELIVNTWTTAPVVDLENDDTLTPTGLFPLGVTTVTLTSTEDGSELGTDDALVTVEDTTPPVVRVKMRPAYLWPPNHSMQEVEARVRIRDNCSSADDYTVVLMDVKSSEPDNSTGDGNTVNDIQGDDVGTDDRKVLLRAERKGNGSGRVYTLKYLVTDGGGNETEAEGKVYVPHDHSDLKDLLGDDDGDHGDMEPICPRPTEAVDELGEIFPGIGSTRNEKTCKNVCKAWAKSCRQVGSGSAKCATGETKALTYIELAECKDSDDRDEIKLCRADAKVDYKAARAALKLDASEAKETCADHGEQCLDACEAMFGAVIQPI
jgi:hypothetical protein